MDAKALNDQIRHLCAQVIMAQDDEIEPILTTSQLLIPYMILRAVKGSLLPLMNSAMRF